MSTKIHEGFDLYVMGNSTIPESPYRVPFFTLFIVSAVIFTGLQVRFIMIIQMSKELSKLPAYRIAQHSSIACGINIITQLIAAACTITGDMDRTLNWVNGALFHGSWSADYPIVLLSAAHRLAAVALPFSVDWIFSMQHCYIMLAMAWCFGAFNAALCFSGQVYSVWVPTTPSFAFEGDSFIADIVNIMDFYFAEFILFASFGCYIALFIIITYKYNRRKSFKLEGPLIIHCVTIFATTAVTLFLWHHPLSDSPIFTHTLTYLGLVRMCLSPIVALLTNRFHRFCSLLNGLLSRNSRLFSAIRRRYILNKDTQITVVAPVSRVAESNRSPNKKSSG